MNPTNRRLYRFFAGLACLLLLAACANRPAPVRSGALPFDRAVEQAVDDLVVQTSKLPSFLQKVESKVKIGRIVIDPFIDASTGQQTEVSRQAEQQVLQRMRSRFPQYDILSFNANELPKAQYVLTGTLAQPRASGERGHRLTLALTEFKSELVIAQSSARISDNNLDTTPTASYRDSPAMAKDRGIEGYIRTTETTPGSPADAVYLEHLPTSALIADASTAYNAERYHDALSLYEAASKRQDGQQLRVLNGVYNALTKLQRTADAERAFGAIVRLGLATNNLSLKLLFKPGSTEFIGDVRVSGPYAMWLRQIARQLSSSEHCITVVGHTSRTGSEQTNERLSLQRATGIRKRLETEAPTLTGRLSEAGMGYRENIIGTGTDDSRDALDRRVEFRVVECRAS